MAALPASSSPAISESPTCNFLPIQQNHYHSLSKVSFGFTPEPKFGLFSKNLSGRILTVKAQLNKVALDGSNHAPSPSHEKSGLPAQEKKNDEPSSESSPAASVSEERVSEFLSQVAGLVKLVDSRDIVELQLKQLDCEILIRKQEAIPQPQIPNPTHVVAMQPPPPPVASAPAPVSSPATPRPALPAPAPAATSAKPSLPPLKSPMSGTFYRSPAPGEPPFVKVGDKVKKGQVICIIEAMKLMNEIEADQSGTIIEILAEDGKPVSLDTPLLVIQP